jgi:hypothetical protein
MASDTYCELKHDRAGKFTRVRQGQRFQCASVFRGGFARLLLLLPLIALCAAPALAQAPPAPPPPPPPAAPLAAPAPAPGPSLSEKQLENLVSRIALYPDPLLAQILMAATYPLEIVEADRWLQQPANAALKGDQLAAALAQQPWDPSVKSLVAFPPILRMMDSNLTWTEALGDAFLAAQAAVMDSVQRLRREALAAGKLKSTPQQVVSEQDGIITIEPAGPGSVYVPVYNPEVVYGGWPYPEYPPDYFPGFFPEVPIGPLDYGWVDVVTIGPLFGFGHCDWHHHRIDIDAKRFSALDPRQPAVTSSVWQHNPSHRDGVPYRDPAVRARFEGAATAERIRAARGFPTGAAAPMPGTASTTTGFAAPLPGPAVSGARPAPAEARPPVVLRPTPPILQSFGRGAEVRAEALRGQTSRMSAPARRRFAPIAAPRPAAPMAAAPRIAVPVPRAAPGRPAGVVHR